MPYPVPKVKEYLHGHPYDANQLALEPVQVGLFEKLDLEAVVKIRCFIQPFHLITCFFANVAATMSGNITVASA